MEKSLFPMKKISIEAKAIKERLEPLNTLEKPKQFEQMCGESPILCAQLYHVRTAIRSLYADHFAVVRNW